MADIGSFHEGEYKDGWKHGHGKLTYNTYWDGSVKEGRWERGNFKG